MSRQLELLTEKITQLDARLSFIIKQLDSVERKLNEIRGPSVNVAYSAAYVAEARRLISENEEMGKQIRGPSAADIAERDRVRGRMF